jgi:hypothetical protein
MSGVGSGEVADYTNTTTANAQGVVATGDVGGAGTVAQYVPLTPTFIVTNGGDFLVTDAGNFLVTT